MYLDALGLAAQDNTDYNNIIINNYLRLSAVGMIQKVLRIGSSAAVTIPRKSLDELGIRIGDSIHVDIDAARNTVLIRPARAKSQREKKIVALALNFIERYRSDLKALARK